MVFSDVALKKDFSFDGFEEDPATFCGTECWLVSSFGRVFFRFVSQKVQLNSSIVVPFPSHIVYKSPGMNVPIKFKADKFVMWVGNKWLQTKYGFISYF